jgi:hypothetical protein
VCLRVVYRTLSEIYLYVGQSFMRIEVRRHFVKISNHQYVKRERTKSLDRFKLTNEVN